MADKWYQTCVQSKRCPRCGKSRGSSKSIYCQACSVHNAKQKMIRKNAGDCPNHRNVKRPCVLCKWSIAESSLRKYGISLEEFAWMEHAQNRLCAICQQRPDSGRDLAVDHDHETGQIRGLLCDRCNPGIGMFPKKENLLRAYEYLKKFGKENG